MSAAEPLEWAGWDNLPRDLREGLEGALAGLSEAFPDAPHPLAAEWEEVWRAVARIEGWVLTMERLKETLWEFRE